MALDTIRAYKFEAGIHCPACIKARDAARPFEVMHTMDLDHTGKRWKNKHAGILSQDGHGIPFSALDREGNNVWPVFECDLEAEQTCDRCGDVVG